MSKQVFTPLLAILAVGIIGLRGMPLVQAANFSPMDMMNPNKFFGGKDGRHDPDDVPPGYGPGPYPPGPFGY